MPAEGMSIGIFARAAKVNIETIRYYQRCGLLEIPRKMPRGQRRYPPELLERVHFIKRAQASGFSLGEIGTLLKFNKSAGCGDVRTILDSRLDATKKQIEKLLEIRKTLCAFMEKCNGISCPQACPILKTLDAHSVS